MINDAFVAFWSGMAGGVVVGIMLFSFILAMKTDEERRRLDKIKYEKEKDNV